MKLGPVHLSTKDNYMYAKASTEYGNYDI